jgi:hypothetical protein
LSYEPINNTSSQGCFPPNQPQPYWAVRPPRVCIDFPMLSAFLNQFFLAFFGAFLNHRFNVGQYRLVFHRTDIARIPPFGNRLQSPSHNLPRTGLR